MRNVFRAGNDDEDDDDDNATGVLLLRNTSGRQTRCAVEAAAAVWDNNSGATTSRNAFPNRLSHRHFLPGPSAVRRAWSRTRVLSPFVLRRARRTDGRGTRARRRSFVRPPNGFSLPPHPRTSLPRV